MARDLGWERLLELRGEAFSMAGDADGDFADGSGLDFPRVLLCVSIAVDLRSLSIVRPCVSPAAVVEMID